MSLFVSTLFLNCKRLFIDQRPFLCYNTIIQRKHTRPSKRETERRMFMKFHTMYQAIQWPCFVGILSLLMAILITL